VAATERFDTRQARDAEPAPRRDAGADQRDAGADQRLAHAGYIAAVAAALEAAGVPVADWRADGGEPRDGWIPFDLARQVRLHGWPVWDHDEAGAGWSEETGWYLLTVDDPAGRDVRTVKGLDVAVIAAPGAVARAVADLAGLPSAGPSSADLPSAGPSSADLPSAGPPSAGPPSAGPSPAGPSSAVEEQAPGGPGTPSFEEELLRYAGSRTKAG